LSYIRFNKNSRIEELQKYKILKYSLTTFFGFGEVCCIEIEVEYILGMVILSLIFYG
jgi:predicted HAD superfamily hydrolase